jgi:hypothetical protein
MKVFTLREFSETRYHGTLFSEIMVVDDRNPELASREPIPPESRVMAFRVAAKYSIWPAMKLDGSPDFRYNPVLVGGGDQWTPLSLLIEHLTRAKQLGDIFYQDSSSAVPLTSMKWERNGILDDAAILTSLKGWSLPLYFHGLFQDFIIAVDIITAVQNQIYLGTAEYINIYPDR